MTTLYTKEQIINLIETNDRAVNRAVLAIYKNQTSDEQNSEATLYHNNIGFSAADARLMTYYATYIEKTGSLSGTHLEKARKKIKKYWRQLLEIANNK